MSAWRIAWWMGRRSSAIVMALALSFGWAGLALAEDVDSDGVDDAVDVCLNTPPGIAVDDTGRPVADLDRDCDVDLSDYALLQTGFTGPLPQVPPKPLVNVQITEEDDIEALEAFMVEVNARQIKATLIVDETTAAGGCTQLRDYDAQGHEIMVYGRPDEPPGEVVNLTMLDYDGQKEVINRAKIAIEECLEHPVEGFRSYHFSHNEITWGILDELSLIHNLSFVGHTSNSVPGHENDDWPYEMDGYNFWAVPMHAADMGGGVFKAFCDRPFRTLSAEDWEALMKSEMHRMADQGLPFKVEFHPWYSFHDPGRWDAYVHFLDYAVAQGAEFITIEEMVDRMPK